MLGQAYVRVKHEDFVDPSDAYKIACCKTVYTHRSLLGRGEERSIELPIFNACTNKQDSTFKFTITEDVQV